MPHHSKYELTTAAIARAVALLVALIVASGPAACGGLGGEHGGAENLPNRGIVPYDRQETDGSPFVLEASPPVARYEGPGAVWVDPTLFLYVGRVLDDGTRDIVVATSDRDGLAFDAPVVALDDASDPAPTVRGDTLWLAFVDAATGNIGIARGDGATLTELSRSALAPASGQVFSSPSVAFTVGQASPTLILSVAEADGATYIAKAEVTPDSTPDSPRFGGPVPLLRPGVECRDAFDVAEPCWDADVVNGSEVRVARTATGRTLWRLFYRGARRTQAGVGFAASFDALADEPTWQRYAFNPVAGERMDESGPTNVFTGDRYLLYWSENRSGSPSGIAAAVNAAPKPSASF